MLQGALRQLFALAEAYPDLKANENFKQLQAELGDIENKIAAARRFFNSTAAEYNATREAFPGQSCSRACSDLARRISSISTRASEQRHAMRPRFSSRTGRAYQDQRGALMFRAYGLYTHIRANRIRAVSYPVGRVRRASACLVVLGAAAPECIWRRYVRHDRWPCLSAIRALMADCLARRARLVCDSIPVSPIHDQLRDSPPREYPARRRPSFTMRWRTSASHAVSRCQSSR